MPFYVEVLRVSGNGERVTEESHTEVSTLKVKIEFQGAYND